MIQLEHFIKTELAQLETNAVGVQLNGPAFDTVIARGIKNQRRTKIRLDQDPALAMLTNHFIDPLWMIAMSGLPPRVAHESIKTYLAMMVLAWENANIRFNDQFKPAP